MAANMEEVQAEMDAILANAEERTALEEAGKQRAEFMDDPTAEFGRNVTIGISNIVGIPVNVVNTVLNGIGIGVEKPMGGGENIQDVLDELGGAPEGLPREPEGPMAGAAQMLGTAAVVTPAMVLPFLSDAMSPTWDLDQSRRMGEFHGTGEGTPGHIPRTRAAKAAFLLKNIGRDVAKFAAENPKTFIAGETAAALAAGAAGEYAEEAGAGPGTRMAAEVGAGIVAGITPAAIPRQMTNMYRWGMRNIVPMLPEGAELRAAQQMQVRAEDPEAAAAAVRGMLDEKGNVKPGFEGVTPARVAGEERLMAQEQRVLKDDPALDKQVREDLQAAVKRAEVELRELYGTPRGRESWEQAVFQRVAPEGVEISPGTSEEMLDQLYQSFRPLYDEIKGYPIMPNLFGQRKTSLETMIRNVPETNRIQADQSTRDAVSRRLNSMWQGLSRRIKPDKDGTPLADSADYLRFRQRLREEGRKANKRGDQTSAELYRIAEEKVNAVLKSQLKPEVLDRLGWIDGHYRNYKITEDAVFRRAATDAGLTPEGLLASLKASASSKGGYARGEMGELRSVAVSGKPIAKILEDPAMIRRRVANMSEDELANTKADFFDTLMRKSMVSVDETEGVSGEKMLRMLDHYGESAVAVRMSDDELARARVIATELQTAERKSPAAVAELYEDGPSNILSLLATLVGAKHGQKIAGRGMGSSLVLAQYFANKARGVLGHFTTEGATELLTRAQTDPELYAHLLTKPGARPQAQVDSGQFLHAYLFELARERGVDISEYYKKTHKQEQAYAAKMREIQDAASQLSPLH